MNWLSRTGLSLGTIVAPLIGGLFLFSVVGTAVCTPPFNDRLGWVVTIDHGEARIGWNMHRSPGPKCTVSWHPANHIVMVPSMHAADAAPSASVPLWIPFVLVGIPTIILHRCHRSAVQREEAAFAAA